MKLWTLLFLIALSFLLGFFLSQKFAPTSGGHTINNIIYQDTGTHTIIEKPVPYYVEKLIVKNDTIKIDSLIFIIPDTAQIIAEYLQKRGYRLDTTISEVNISINEIIALNRLISRDVKIKNNRATSVNVINPLQKFGVGLLVGGNNDNFDIAPILNYNTDNLTFQAQYHVFDKAVYVGIVKRF